MSKKISGAEYPLAKIFSSEFDYFIPSYQRPYAWTTEEVTVLFDDLYDFYRNEEDDNYFLGSIVLIKDENHPAAEVIDGQQRLTTLTILLACLTDRLSGDSRQDFMTYLREPGRPSQGLKASPRLTLRNRDQQFFETYVQNLAFDRLFALDPAHLDTEAQRNIQANGQILAQRLDRCFTNEAALIGFGAFLVQRCYLVAVSTPSQQSAFRVFSVMNNRGMDLLPSDIIKADVIGAIAPDKQQAYTEKWEELEIRAGRSDFNNVFTHIRMIYARTKARRAILDEFKEYVLQKMPSSEYFIDNVLAPYAEAYLTLKSGSYSASKNADEINDYLKWLNQIDNADWFPVAMRFFAQKGDKPDYLLWFMQRLERLAAYLHLTSRDVNQRIERYAKVLTEMSDTSHSLQKPLESIELTADEKQRFLAMLDGDIYNLPARRRNYLLLRLDAFLSDGAASYDAKRLTIEHVLPQSVPAGSQWADQWADPELHDQWVHRLANLVLLTQRRNAQAQNYDFAKKKKIYFSGRQNVTSYVLTSQVLSENAWTPKIVQARQKRLLKTLAENWALS